MTATVHWPTADAKHVWCACGKTFKTAEDWQQHVARRVIADYLVPPVDEAGQLPHRGS